MELFAAEGCEWHPFLSCCMTVMMIHSNSHRFSVSEHSRRVSGERLPGLRWVEHHNFVENRSQQWVWMVALFCADELEDNVSFAVRVDIQHEFLPNATHLKISHVREDGDALEPCYGVRCIAVRLLNQSQSNQLVTHSFYTVLIGQSFYSSSLENGD